MNLHQAHLEPAHTTAVNTSVVDIARRLRDNKLRHLYILDEKDFPIGIVSITDINNKIVAEGKNPSGLTARDIMTAPLHMMEIDNDVNKAYAEMLAHNTYSLPIVDNGLLVGVISMGEALKLLVQEKRGGT